MAKTVFILGAGASVEAGAPLMNDFLDRAQDLLTNGAFSSNQEEENSIKELFQLISRLEAIHSRAPIDLNNIESLFGLIEMGNIIMKIGDEDPQLLNYYRNSLITLIARTLEESMKFRNINSELFSHKSYSSFCEFLDNYQNKGNTASIITFNYDLGIDISLSNTFNNSIDYCLDETSIPRAIKLMKLHGSINWVFVNKSIEILERLKIDNDLRLRASKTIQTSYAKDTLPIIIPPTWNKSQYHSQLSNVWNHAANELNNADNLVIIGFSIPETDIFFKYLLGLGLMNGKRIREIIIINKDNSDNIKKRYNNLFGFGISPRLKYIPKTFMEGLNELIDNKDFSHFNITKKAIDLSSFFY